MKKKAYIIVFSLVVVFSACVRDKLPKGFPNQKEFAIILADVHYAEAIISQAKFKRRGADSIANYYYHDVLSNYKLTQEKFDTIVNWYVAHPEIYQKVYEESIGLLTEKEAFWQNEEKKIAEEKKELLEEKRARSIWHEQKNYFISIKDTFDRRIPFKINVDTIENASAYKLSADYQFLNGNDIEEAILEIISMNQDSILDTLVHKLPIIHTTKKAELIIDQVEGDKIIMLSGMLLKHDTLKEVRGRIKNIEFEYLPREDSVDIK